MERLGVAGAGAAAGGGCAQLGALVWLKWRLLRNSLRSRRGAANRAATALGALAAGALSLLFAAGVGVAGYSLVYALAGAGGAADSAAVRGAAAQTMLMLFSLLSIIMLMWALVPLSLGGGSRFDPGPLLLYPVSLRKLFAIDLVSEMASLSTLFAAPSLLAVGLGAGLASGRLWRSLAAAAVAVCFGAALSKLVSTAVGSLMRKQRTRGEMLLAALSVVGAFSGVILSQGFELIRVTQEFPAPLRWTPPGALVVALAPGAGGAGAAAYASALAVLAAYAAAAVWLSYTIAARSLGSSGGAGKRRAGARAAADPTAARAAGWRVPLLSTELATVFEKEARYALRNAQLRVIVLMPVVMTVALGIGLDPRRGVGDMPASVAPYFEGVRPGLGMFYVFVILSALGGNLFGFDGAGARAYVLSPVSRRTILVGKNLAALCVAAVAAVLVTVANRFVHGAASARGLLFAALCFVYFAGFFTVVGNYVSLRFPRRLQFGKRMSASGVAGLLMLPTFVAAIIPPGLAAVAGWLSASLWVEYVILAAFASISVAAYLLLVNRQGRELERRELDILEVVTGRDAA